MKRGLIRFSLAIGTSLLGLGVAQGSSQELVLETPSGKLYGTLQLPGGSGPFPVALIHPGSGPTDRDGNSPLLPGKNDSLKLLAEGLAQNGIASLRIDKRGIGKSAGAALREQDLRFDGYIKDSQAWLELLRKDRRFNKFIVIGHSEGSLIGMVAAREAKADAFISLAGIGQTADALLLEQLKPQLSPEMYTEAARVVGELKAGRTVPESQIKLPAQLVTQLFRASVQPYLISWFAYNPAQEIAKLSVPVLIVQGTTDLQVQAKEADALAGANPKAKKVLIEGMNHVLKSAPAEQTANFAAYSNPSLPLAPSLLQNLVDFIRAL